VKKVKNRQMIRISFLLCCIALFSGMLHAQEKQPFYGKLVYSVQIADTAFNQLFRPRTMVVYTNDTIIRIENESDQLGKQVIIKHLGLNKSYLLLQTPDQNFAIQTDHSSEQKKVSKYAFKKKCFKRKIAGKKANRLEVHHPDMKTERQFLYLKDYSPKYINTFEDFPGLPVHYFIISVDGVYEYKLLSMEEFLPSKDLFGIPSDYKRVTLDEFMDHILKVQGGTAE